MGVKFAASLGSEVTVLSTLLRKTKEADAKEVWGAHNFIHTKDESQMKSVENAISIFIIDTVSRGNMNLNTYP